MRILFVENNSQFARIVVAAFLGEHDVVLVPSISAAREAWCGAVFDVVLVDYDLDDGKGDELIKEVRGSGFEGKIIAVSSHEPGNAALLVAGADDVCPKTKFMEIARLL